MRRLLYWALIPALLFVFTVGLAACGGDDDEGDGGEAAAEEFAPPTSPPDDAKRGGTLEVIASADIDFMDPGAAYYQFTYIVDFAWQRALMGWPPDEDEAAQPDLADGEPQVSDGGRTVTFKIRDGVRFSPPVDREITSADFKYAIERGLMPGVANPYISSYFGDVVGFAQAEAAVGNNPNVAPEISGITTPDDRTLVFRMSRPTAPVIIGALSLPLGAPVPEEYAREHDRESPSAYGEYAVGTGPYMVENNADGQLTGYNPGRSITMVRNPNWDPATDYRPAYLDRIEIREGFTDVNSAVRRVLEGESQTVGDIIPEPQGLKLAATQFPDQLAVVPGSGDRYPALNTSKPPFNDINVRKATVAGIDREALLLARGGELAGQVPTHFIFPLIPGYEESGGEEGFGFDFYANPNGDPEVSAKYFRQAGYQSGKYEGDEEVLVIGENAGIDKRIGEIMRDELTKLGFNVNLRQVSSDTMYTRFCNVVATNYDVCSTVGWIADFRDPQAVLQVPFSGDAIQPTNNSNWPLLDNPAINRAIDEAVLVTDPEERAQAWADVNRMITAQAPAAIYNHDSQGVIWSQDVNAVVSLNNSTIDLSFTSLKNP